MFRFETPWALLAILLPLALYFWRRRQRPPALPVADGGLFAALPTSWRVRCAWIPTALWVLSWILLTIALARPQRGTEQIRQLNQGIAIEMVLDRSGSMRYPMEYKGQRLNRLETVKAVFRDFVFGNKNAKLSGRHNDLLGVIEFAHYPYTVCPLTLDHNALAFALKNIQLITEAGDENGTAIGDAVAMGVARLVSAEKTLAAQTNEDAGAYRIQSKIVILLTDGQDEGPHTRSISQAAQLAKEHGIKVYTIAMVSKNEQRLVNTPLGPISMGSGQEYDTTDIQAMAATTGGIFRTCDSADALTDIYREIDRLEKSQVESLRYVSHHELYLPFTAAALAAVVLALLLQATIFRRMP